MHEVDHLLLHQARTFITGANVHYVNTWIFCYETSAADLTGRRERYEKLLRDFVASNTLLRAARMRIESNRRRLA
jgi:hypothetical protein